MKRIVISQLLGSDAATYSLYETDDPSGILIHESSIKNYRRIEEEYKKAQQELEGLFNAAMFEPENKEAGE